jgi:glutathione S-transferase
MLKIWGRANSINVMKVLWVADELKLDYERVDAGMSFGVVSEDWYAAMNPNRRVPTIDDDGLILWESNAIVRYLAAKHDVGGLSPADPGKRAASEKWMDWQLSTPQEDMTYVFWGMIRNSSLHADKAIQAKAVADLNEHWKIVDAALAERNFIADDQLTVGDIPLGCLVERWSKLPIERANLPNLQAWHERLVARPAFQRHVVQELT